MPSIPEIKQTIMDSSGRDWEFFDDPEIYVYSPDPRIRIEQQEGRMAYNAPWLEPFHHAEDTVTRVFRVYFGSSPVDQLRVLWIDEGRFQIPSPQIEPDLMQIDSREDIEEISINRYQAAVGRAMTRERFDSYLERGNITVRDEVL